MGSRVLATYRIQYGNGVVQIKNLINHSDYIEIIKPTKDLINQLEINREWESASAEKRRLKSLFGDDYFTTQSSLYKAISCGILWLPICQGGGSSCKMELISVSEFSPITHKLHWFDSVGVRIYPYRKSSGCLGLDIYRKPIRDEVVKNEWDMIKITHTDSYFTRIEAEEAALKIGKQIYQEIKDFL